MKYPKKSGIDQNDDKGETIDSRYICHLDKREIEILRITQVGPGETCEKEGAEIFQGNPEDRGEKNGLKP